MAKRKATDYIVVHHSATRPSSKIDAAWIKNEHRKRGYLDIGYHFVINRTGLIEAGRQMDETGAHVKGKNGVSLGICLIGGVKETNVNEAEQNFTEKQFRSLGELLTVLRRSYPKAKILRHKDLAATLCCDINLEELCDLYGLSSEN